MIGLADQRLLAGEGVPDDDVDLVRDHQQANGLGMRGAPSPTRCEHRADVRHNGARVSSSAAPVPLGADPRDGRLRAAGHRDRHHGLAVDPSRPVRMVRVRTAQQHRIQPHRGSERATGARLLPHGARRTRARRGVRRLRGRTSRTRVSPEPPGAPP